MPAPTNNFNISQNLQVYGNMTVTGDTIIQSLSATSFSASTYQGNVVSQITAGSGISINQSTGNVTITATGGGGGGVSGSGTSNYLPKWTGTTALGNSQIRDDGTSIGVGIAPSAPYKMYVYSITNPTTLYVQNQYSNGTGIYVYANGSNSQTGIRSSAWGDSGTENIGVVGEAVDGNTAIGVKGAVSPSEFGSVTTGIGGYFDGIGNGAYGYPSNSYSVQLIDGTEGTNKVLISKTSDGKANWSSSLTGLTSVSATTYYNLPVSGLTQGTNVTITNNGSGNYTISSTGAAGGSPGGNTGEVQYNGGSGNFSGASNVEISSSGNLVLVATADPSTPNAGTLTMYSKTIAGRTLPKIKGPSGLDYVLQSALFQNAIYLWNQTSATGGSWLGTVGTGNGTFANTLPTTGGGGNAYTIQKRARYSNVVTTLNQTLGQRSTENIFFRGSVAGQGGFFFYTRCGFDTWTNGGRFFAGLATAVTVVTADPSALNNTVGFCVDAADNGVISFLTRGTSATKQSTGLTITSGKGYDIFIFNQPNSGTFYYRIVDLITGTEYSNSATLTPPAAGTGLSANVLASNASLTPVNSIQIGVSKIYVETDY